MVHQVFIARVATSNLALIRVLPCANANANANAGLSIGFGALSEPDDVSKFVTVVNIILGSSAMFVSPPVLCSCYKLWTCFG